MTRRKWNWLNNRWLRLFIGIAFLGGFFAFLTTKPRPPGTAGKIIDRNLSQDVQATALFYSDLDRMPEIENRLESIQRNRHRSN
jgi:hypothetical protein